MHHTQLFGIRLDWGEDELTDSEREELMETLDHAIHAAVGYTTRRHNQRYRRQVRGSIEVLRDPAFA